MGKGKSTPTLQQVAEIILVTRGDKHRSTVTGKQLCCHWNGNMVPSPVLYQGLFSTPGHLPHSPHSLFFQIGRETKSGFSLSGIGQRWKQCPGGKKQSCSNMILAQLSSGIRGTSAGFKISGFVLGSWHNPNQKWHVLFQVKMSLARWRACASCCCWKLKPETVLLHFPDCS